MFAIWVGSTEVNVESQKLGSYESRIEIKLVLYDDWMVVRNWYYLEVRCVGCWKFDV